MGRRQEAALEIAASLRVCRFGRAIGCGAGWILWKEPTWWKIERNLLAGAGESLEGTNFLVVVDPSAKSLTCCGFNGRPLVSQKVEV